MNEFEKLCKLASERDWCWNLHCGTCGNLQLRIGLSLIAHDIPLNSWDYSHELPDVISDYFDRHTEFMRCGFMPMESEEMSSCLSKVLSEANLKTIRKNHQGSYSYNYNYAYPSEDWLGYLGVVIHRVLSGLGTDLVDSSWKTQLNQMIGPITRLPEAYIFDDLFSEQVTVKQLEDYETIFHALKH